MIPRSLNEIDSTVRKAARGAGLSWGLAEEAGKAASWLAARDLPGVELAAALLARNDGTPYEALVPVIEGDRWRARSGRLCPLIAGTAVNDRAEAIAGGAAVTLAAVSYPLLLLPFAGRAAEAGCGDIEMSWSGFTAQCRADGLHIVAADPDAMTADEAQDVKIRATHTEAAFTHHPRTAAEITAPPAIWSRLEALAHRTYVPATEASRVAGAGAGLSDND